MNVIVINKRNQVEARAAQAAGYCVIYVGKGSVFANPYHGQEGGLDMYRKWLWRQMQTGNPAGMAMASMRDTIVKGKKLAIECWCDPAPCHADIIKNALDWAVDRAIAREMGAKVPEIKVEDVVVATKTVKKGTRKRTETALMKKIRERDEKAANAKPKKVKALKDEEHDYILSQSSIATDDEI